MNIILSWELVLWAMAKIEDITSVSSTNPRLRRVTSELNAIPLFLDSGGGLALKPNGQILEFLWECPNDAQPVDDPRLVNTALFQGSKIYPELAVLVPPRQPDATMCPYCQGTGYPISALGSNIDNIVCYCGGVGWIP